MLEICRNQETKRTCGNDEPTPATDIFRHTSLVALNLDPRHFSTGHPASRGVPELMHEYSNQLQWLHNEGVPQNTDENEVSNHAAEERNFIRATAVAELPVDAAGGRLADGDGGVLEEPCCSGVGFRVGGGIIWIG